MHTIKPVLSGKGLLMASIAFAASPALAETAGRVSFVTGEVTASSADGSTRQLRKGDTINGGDKISTRAGRLQIRFTDGGFVSLQPNTVFGVDQYLYTNKAPEETSLFFSLLQGGMRTVTGAIGKVNKQSYKVRTPVATIGIRGTGYLASITERGLIVSVGSGFVSVSNENGQITGGAGQNIRVPDGSSSPDLSTDAPEVQAPGVDGDSAQLTQQESQDNSLNNGVAIGNVQSANGDYLFLFTTNALPSSNLNTGSPDYYVAYANYGYTDLSTGLLATFDGSGGISKLYDNYELPADPSNPIFDKGSLQIVNSGIAGQLAWGEFTNGSSDLDYIFCGGECSNTELGSTDFLPYVIGAPATGNLAKGTATYTYQGGTPPRSSTGQTGKIDSLRIAVDLDFATMDLAMQLTMKAGEGTGNTVYNITTSNAAPVPVANIGTANSFYLGSDMLDVSASDSGACFSDSCSAEILGFFAGKDAAQIGLSYGLYSSYESISGVAALGLSGYTGTQLKDGPGYTAAFAYQDSSGVAGDPSEDPANSLSLTFNPNDGGLQYATDGYGDTTFFDRGSSTAVQVDDKGSSGTLKWGRWYASDAIVTAPDNSNLTLTPSRALHYLVGPMTQPNIFMAFVPGSSATYAYQGGSVSDSNGGKGTLSGQLAVAFGSIPTLTADLNLNMNSGAGYHIVSNNPLPVGVSVEYGYNASGTASFSASNNDLTVTGTGGGACFSGSGCSGALNGFFSGQQAQQIGLSYTVNDQGMTPTSIAGVAAFGRGAVSAPPPNPPIFVD